ncbi:hypothetical protein HD806DRAFT_526426 [Xylariaceae sp. AK1471]|nr:hypothetical protein HD806DRAFT_526426 [Xylariaceae sp. AK1471]
MRFIRPSSSSTSGFRFGPGDIFFLASKRCRRPILLGRLLPFVTTDGLVITLRHFIRTELIHAYQSLSTLLDAAFFGDFQVCLFVKYLLGTQTKAMYRGQTERALIDLRHVEMCPKIFRYRNTRVSAMNPHSERKKKSKGSDRAGSPSIRTREPSTTTSLTSFTLGHLWPAEEEEENGESSVTSKFNGNKRRNNPDYVEGEAKFPKVIPTIEIKKSEYLPQVEQADDSRETTLVPCANGEKRRNNSDQVEGIAKRHKIDFIKRTKETEKLPDVEQVEVSGEPAMVRVARKAKSFQITYGSGPNVERSHINPKKLHRAYSNPVLLALRQPTETTDSESPQTFYAVAHSRMKAKDDDDKNSSDNNSNENNSDGNNSECQINGAEEDPPGAIYFLGNYTNLHEANQCALVEFYECYSDVAAFVCHESCVCPKGSWITTKGRAEWLKDDDGCIHLRADYEDTGVTAMVYVTKQVLKPGF